MLAEVDQANEFQRRYYEKIREYNRDVQARNAVQSSNVTQLSRRGVSRLRGALIISFYTPHLEVNQPRRAICVRSPDFSLNIAWNPP